MDENCFILEKNYQNWYILNFLAIFPPHLPPEKSLKNFSFRKNNLTY